MQFLELLKNETFVWGAMSIIVLLLSQLLKLPIKAITKKTIKDKTVRDRVNAVIMLIPLGLGVLADYLFCTLYLGIPFNVAEGIQLGTTALTTYSVFERLIKGNVSKETQATIELAENIAKDGKVDTKDGELVKEFVDKVQ